MLHVFAQYTYTTTSSADAGVSAVALLIYSVVVLVLLGVNILVLVDVVRRSDQAFVASGQNKTLWIVLAIVGFFCCGLISLIIDGIYWFAIRPKVKQAEEGGGYGGGYGQPYPPQQPGGYPPQPDQGYQPPPGENPPQQ